ILHCINKLYSLPVTVQHLQDTGVGKTINSLRKSEGEVGESARALVYKWKQMVEEESENEQEPNVNVRAHSKYNGNSENNDHKEKFEKRGRESSSKPSRPDDHKEHGKLDHTKDYKRKRDSDHDQNKDKRLKSEKIVTIKNYNSTPDENRSINGDDENFGLEEDWTIGRRGSGTLSDDDRDIRHGFIKTERHSSEEGNAQSSDDEVHHKKPDRQEKSHKHKTKSSSSSSERSKHSSSKHELKESKSSSSKYKEEKSSSSGSSSHTKKDSSNSSDTKGGDRSRNKEKDKKDKHKDKRRSREEKKSSKEKKEKEKKKSDDEDGVDSFSGKSFEAALGMISTPQKSKKKSSSGTSSSYSPSKKKPKSSSSSSEKKAKDVCNFSYEMEQESPPQLPPSIDVDEDFGLPALNPNYKPLPQPSFFNSPPKRYQSEDDALSNIMYSKVQRTKVYSGNKTGYTHVPSLFDLCTRVLQENIDALEYTGGVPFDLLKPVLERATPDQLFTLEHYNAYLIEDTDMFWEYHCKKDFRNKKREEMETWREMYLRCREERESKLKSLTANIAASSKAKLLPVRKTQLAYIEGTAKPPRNIARKQAKFGTAHASSSSIPSKAEGSGLSSSFTGRSSTVSAGPAVSVPAPRGAGSSSSHSSSCKPKPKAPLMQKALQLIKYNRFKR
ncbi:Transcription elongation factor B polypeptide 3, partial [Frankliniella fusca]